MSPIELSSEEITIADRVQAVFERFGVTQSEGMRILARVWDYAVFDADVFSRCPPGERGQ